MPTLVMVDPILEIAWPPQSLRKSRVAAEAAEEHLYSVTWAVAGEALPPANAMSRECNVLARAA